MDEWIDALRSSLLLDGDIQPETIAQVLQRPGWIDPGDLELVRTLTQANPLFLTRWEVENIISAEISEKEALAQAKARRERCQKVAELYPEILRLLRKKTNFVLRYVAERLHDLAHDFGVPATEIRRPDKVLRDKLRQAKNAKASFEASLDALAALTKTLPEFGGEFHRVNWAALTHAKGVIDDADDLPSLRPNELERTLKHAIVALEIVDFDLSSELPRDLQRDYRMGKRDVVALAYDFHVSCGGPPLVTTPGSQFSYLCSLIYEVATGVVGEGLAGAIIDFARSRQREEEDQYQQEVERDESAYRTGDNFYHHRQAAENDARVANWYNNAAARYQGKTEIKAVLVKLADLFGARAKQTRDKFGPFIVWADHLPKHAVEKKLAETQELEEQMRELRIRLGNLRRKQRD